MLPGPLLSANTVHARARNHAPASLGRALACPVGVADDDCEERVDHRLGGGYSVTWTDTSRSPIHSATVAVTASPMAA